MFLKCQETAISCGWTKDSIECTTARGYEFDGDVTDHLTLGITRIQNINNGTCSCHITAVSAVDHKKGAYQQNQISTVLRGDGCRFNKILQ